MITVVITQHEKQTYYKRATCRVFGFIALLSAESPTLKLLRGHPPGNISIGLLCQLQQSKSSELLRSTYRKRSSVQGVRWSTQFKTNQLSLQTEVLATFERRKPPNSTDKFHNSFVSNPRERTHSQFRITANLCNQRL